MPPQVQQAMSTPSKSRREEWQEGIFLALALPLILGAGFFVFGCFRLFSVPSGSMLPSYGIGSYVVVSHLATGFNRYTFDLVPLPLASTWPKGKLVRGDVVVFRLPSDHKTFYIKRIVGLPGDTVAVRNGRLVINGTTAEREASGNYTFGFPHEQTVEAPVYVETLPEGSSHFIVEANGDHGPWDDTPDYSVPGNSVFVMGDNRDNSNDSRQDIGMVPIDLINGKVVGNFRLPGR